MNYKLFHGILINLPEEACVYLLEISDGAIQCKIKAYADDANRARQRRVINDFPDVSLS